MYRVVGVGWLTLALSACGGAAPKPFGGSPPLPSTAGSSAQLVVMNPVDMNGTRIYELATLNLDGSGFQQLTHDGIDKELPHFSPDGTRLLYTRYAVGAEGQPGSQSDVAMYDIESGTETLLTHTGQELKPAWSPDGTRIAWLSLSSPPTSLKIMNADGSSVQTIATAGGGSDDQKWGDTAWSVDNWIIFVVAQNNSAGTCFKTRLDKIRPDGSERTQVTDGGPNCTPPGMEQSGDADPGPSADGQTVYTSRGFPVPPAGASAPRTERRLYAVSSSAWFPGKPEKDLSLPSQPSCIEGVPKGSPDGTRVLLFRWCFDSNPVNGIFVTDTNGSYRTKVADGFGPDWNPAVN